MKARKTGDQLNKLTPAEHRILTVFGGWITTFLKSDAEAQGVADLLDRFERELPEDWRELAGGDEDS